MQDVPVQEATAAPQGMTATEVIIVGGGPGGLAVSQQLGERGIGHVVLEKGAHPGWMWSHTYDSLRLHTGRHLSALPGMPYPKGTDLFPSRADFLRYLTRYVERFSIPLQVGLEARALERAGDNWRVKTDSVWIEAQAVVVATGIMSAPVLPQLPGLAEFGGTVVHSSEYRRPSPYVQQRVLVVGIGNSGAEIATELADAGANVSVSVRSGANNVPRSIAGIPSQYLGWAISWLPKRLQQRLARLLGAIGAAARGGTPIPRKQGYGECPDVPLIGLKLANSIRAGTVALLGEVTGFTDHGAQFADGTEREFDCVILATGYQAAIDWMGDLADRDACGFAKRRDRVRSIDCPGLYFVGHNYDGRGGLYNIAIDAKRIARLIHADHGL